MRHITLDLTSPSVIPQPFRMYPDRLGELRKLFAGFGEPLILPAPPGARPLCSLHINGAQQPIADVGFVEDP